MEPQERIPELLRFTTAGSVDDGKSTLIGRLLHDTKTLYEDQLESVRRVSRDGFELAFLTDGLRAEREQGITIDVAYRHFSTPRRRFIIADTPGHEQYTRNMATGASTAQLAVILIDARKGVLAQTRRHAAIAHLLGIRRIVLAVNKMDLTGFRQDVFEAINRTFRDFAERLGECQVDFIPVCALAGDNVVEPSANTPWYDGPSLLEYLETVPLRSEVADGPFRFPVQSVLRHGSDFRSYAGQVARGQVRAGDAVMVLPSKQIVRVHSIPARDGDLERAFAPMSVSLVLDDHVDVSRGDMLADPTHPPEVGRRIQARVVWMADKPLSLQTPYLIKHTTQIVCAEVLRVLSRLDIETFGEQPAEQLRLNEIGRVELETHRPIYCDSYAQNRATGSFIVIDPVTNLTLGAGMIEEAEGGEQRTPAVSPSGHKGLTVWFTGLSSSGKSTLSQALYERLWAMGHRVELLDGDTVRRNLCKDLGFTKQDRDENIRRIGFVADLLTRNGVVVLVSAISPYRAIREEVRAMIGEFVEIYVNAPLEVCEQRDVKGLYRKARNGQLPGFTGIDDPYEPPQNPEVECRTDRESLAESVDKILRYLDPRLA
ncbi:MAG: adenylyl-sulfate kinase [Bryobacteraceae bacterium]|jgi:bifunctional enzyme CysN/CysC